MRVLLVEDSVKLQTYVAEGLRQAGFSVDVSSDGEDGLWAAESGDYDVLVLDILLPKLDGLSVLRQFRENGHKTHVIMVTAKDTVEDRVVGLEEGADDYLVKPFALDELVARIQALVRRNYGTKAPVISVSDLAIQTANRTVTKAGVELKLQPREYNLLEYLASRAGELVSRDDIERHIYDQLVEPMSNVVDSAICQLRKLIDTPGEPSLIETRRGMGYVMNGSGQ